VDVRTGEVLWEPDEDAISTTRMGRFLDRAHRASGRDLDDYDDLWQWSVDDLEAFWRLVADEFDVVWDAAPETLLADATMPHARWAPDAEVNYARHALRGDGPAIVAHSQTRDRDELSYDQLRDRVARCRAGLQRLGVGRGDRVVAYLPNVPETIVAFLACTSLGAVWSSCAPEFGVEAVVDRVTQIEPSVLLTVDGYRYGAKEVDRREQVAAIREALPSLQATVLLPYLDTDATLPDAIGWDELLAEPGELAFEAVPFDHPLYVLYSSGTTGKPKPIMHGHGGILLEHCKVLGLHHDLGPGDRFSWFTTTGWMMWNYLTSGLLVEATIVLFDGDPGHPDLRTLWRLADEESLDVLGVSAPFLLTCRKEGLRPGDEFDLTGLEQVGSTGAPLPARGSAGSQRRSVTTCRSSPPPAGPTSARRSWLALPWYRCGPARSPAGASAATSRPGPRIAPRWSVSAASSSSPSPCRRCPSASGATRTAAATAPPTSTPSVTCGGTVTG